MPVSPALRAAPLTAASVRVQAVDTLRRAILNFDLTPGQRLVERELVQSLGVSRTTVREALGELKSEGLVTLVPQRGAMVAIPDRQEAADLYEIRVSLESLVVERFIDRATTSQVLRLEAAIESFAENAIDGTSTAGLLEARDEIFSVLMDGAASPTLRQVTEGMQARVNLLRATSLADRTRLHESIHEWRELAAAARDRDRDRAVEIYRGHLRRAADVALASLPDKRSHQ